MKIYDAIREQNIVDYGQKFEEWAPRILVDQYSDQTHFIFELLQNAEDAEATEVEISLFRNKLVLKHNGRSFTDDDVRGICGVSASTKRNSKNRIGKFGIGFKSVYAYTNTPNISSGDYHFEIRNLIMPYEVKENGTPEFSVFILPFDREENGEKAFSEISASLKKNIVADCMLTLSHIRKIRYAIEGEQAHEILKNTRVLGKGIQDVTLFETIGKNQPYKTKLLAFLTDDIKPVQIAFKLGEITGNVKSIVPVTNACLYAFFPTAIETHQSFYIHAPFDTTPARDNVRINDYNKALVQTICELFKTCVIWMKAHNYLNIKFFNQVYPIFKYGPDALLKPIYDAGVALIREGNDILPTQSSNVYGNIGNIYIPESQNILQSFSETMLCKLVNNPDAHWMEKNIVSESSRQFKDYLQENFTLNILKWKNLAENLTSDIMEKETDNWLISLMKNIQPYCFSERADEHINAKNIPLVRLDSGRHCFAFRDDGKPNVYINNPETNQLKIKHSILEDFFSKNFYMRALEIPQYDVFEEIRSNIIPAYIKTSNKPNISENIEHLKTILKAFTENKQKTEQLISSVSIFKTSKGWQTATDVYIPDCYFKSRASDSAFLEGFDISWLSEEYKGFLSVDDLLLLGCHTSACEASVTDIEYNTLLKKYDAQLFDKYQSTFLTKTYHAARDGFSHKKTIDKMPLNLDKIGLGVSLSIAEYIANNSSVYKLDGTVIAANDAALRGKSVVNIDKLPSAIGMILYMSSWIYGKDGVTCKKPSEWRKSEIHPDYISKARNLMDSLPFIQEESIVNELLGHYDVQYQDFLSDLLNNQDVLREAFSTYTVKKNRDVGQHSGNVPQNVRTGKTETDVPGKSENDDSPLVDEIVSDILRKTSAKSQKNKQVGDSQDRNKSSNNHEQDNNDILPVIDEPEFDTDQEEDEYTKPAIDYEKKIEQAKQKSAGEIDKIARLEYLSRKVKSATKYSYEWFCILLEMESLSAFETQLSSKEISITFGKIEREEGTSRTLILSQPSRYIPQYMEDLADIPMVLVCGEKTKTVAIEVANVQSYSLRVKLRTNADVDGIELSEVSEVRINARNPGFLLESLRKQFLDLHYSPEFDMQSNLPENIEFVFGPPGTGKTTYLANQIIKPIIKRENCRILVLAPTNKAADVLTMRLTEVMGNDKSYYSWLVRFGVTNEENIEKEGLLRDKTFDIRAMEKSVTITTISRFSYDYFMPDGERLYLYDLNWDYIVIDEASMISLASIIYPIYKKTPKKFYVAGDPFQIEPITSIDVWKNENIYTIVNLQSFSNPRTVPYQYPVTTLTTQYRSIPAVGRVFSEFAYDGILQHYRTDRDQKKLNINQIIELNALNIIKFPVSKYESIYRAKTLQHKSPYQIYAALFSYELVCFLADAVGKANPNDKFRLGVIAPYKAQSDLIEKLLRPYNFLSNVEVSVGTIHGFQGDECDLVIVVFNPPPTISAARGMFLNKTNIVNVAISRARDYLIVVMPDDNTENIGNLKLVKRLEKIMNTGGDVATFESNTVEQIIFGEQDYLENNTFSTSHQNVNVYGLPEKRYEIRSEDTAIDIQIHEKE